MRARHAVAVGAALVAVLLTVTLPTRPRDPRLDVRALSTAVGSPNTGDPGPPPPLATVAAPTTSSSPLTHPLIGRHPPRLYDLQPATAGEPPPRDADVGSSPVGGPAAEIAPPPPAPPPTAAPAPATPAPRITGRVLVRGRATWYGEEFAGSGTACGERFDPSALTAASRTLPCGTRVVVRNVGTGRTVTVRINDRGPWAGSLVLDLSEAAFATIASLSTGVIDVEVLSVP